MSSTISSTGIDFSCVYPSNTLELERKSSNLNQECVEEIAKLLNPIESESDKILDSIPDYDKHPIYHESRLFHFLHSLKLSRVAFEDIKKYNLVPELPNNSTFVKYISKIDEPLPLFMHYVMFVPTLASQCDNEQKDWWLKKAMNGEMLGAYAQSEIGHGSNVRGILTKALFDKSNDEFVLHTPCLEACKFWVGALGKTATHAVVMAQLIIPKENGEEESFGVHPFLTPLRDPNTFKTYPGLEIWDLGDKFGFKAMDNGMMRITNYRIPRRNMLMKYAHVSADGKYTNPEVDKIQYGTMVSTRAYLVADASRYLIKSVIIATRYSAQRKQFWDKGDNGRNKPLDDVPETPVLDYLTQQLRLFPLLAESYAFIFAGRYMREMYVTLSEQMKNGDFSFLGEAHATTAGLKSYITARVLEGIDNARKTCGGHGYSMFSGIPQILGDFAAKSIAEGDEYVMSFQTGRFCLKTFMQLASGSPVKLGTSFSYMRDYSSFLDSKLEISSYEDLLADPFQSEDDILLTILRFRSLQQISTAATKYKDLKLNSKDLYGSVENEIGKDLYNITNAHCITTIALCFKSQASEIAKLSPASRRAIAVLYQLYCLSRIADDFTPYLLEGYMNKKQVHLVHLAIRELLHVIRPDAVPLVDAFKVPDATLRSIIGRYEGDVYRHLFESVKNSEFNKGKSERIIHAHLMKQIQPIVLGKL